MKNLIANFIKNFSLYTGAIFILSFIIQIWMPNIPISSAWLFILIFMYLFTLAAFTILVKYIYTKITYFANAFMLVNFSKLVLFSVIIFIYAWLVRDDAISFTITFFVYYLLLTTYEIVALLKLQNKKS
jgi:hypothetical protein